MRNYEAVVIVDPRLEEADIQQAVDKLTKVIQARGEMAKLDQDYGDYCREREQQFNQDFDSWRRNRQSLSPSGGPDIGTASNAGVGTTTASMTGTGGAGSAIGAATGVGGSMQADTTRATEMADAGSETGGGGRSGSRSRS